VGSLLARLRRFHRGRLHRAVGAFPRLRLGTATDDRAMEENPVKTFLKLTFPLQPWLPKNSHSNSPRLVKIFGTVS
jgi:hypothetical protein